MYGRNEHGGGVWSLVVLWRKIHVAQQKRALAREQTGFTWQEEKEKYFLSIMTVCNQP